MSFDQLNNNFSKQIITWEKVQRQFHFALTLSFGRHSEAKKEANEIVECHRVIAYE